MPFTVSDFEKLGVFYLGRRYDLAAGHSTDELFLYDSKDLLTHAVCIGMTGSGKTGLCLDLIEEAAIDGVPVIAIDPKGDISNLLLTFPDLDAAEFLPWVSEEEARRAGCTRDAFAAQQAKTWRDGLAQWKQDGDRIRRLRQSADFAIYTPGSTAGLPVSIVGSLAAPPAVVREDSDALKERINSTVGPLLSMLGLDTDPLRSREHILLATILEKTWKVGKDLALADLIHLIQKPPVNNIGALDLESFFSAKERFAFAMSINNLLAAPGFESWLSGEPMSIDNFLYTADAKSKISIFSIAHLSDSERMFFVTLLLSQLVSWMRAQSGMTSLRAILYMDEIFGFFPPVANPPSKLPLLTLLKQARAFGIGVVLASQNPVDLDYKGLANAGTWFIGRLQTERDKMRVIDGLEGAASEVGAGFDRQAMERTLSALARRIFLVNNVHADRQEIIETRWSLSYLRGPLTKAEIKNLMSKRASASKETGLAGGSALSNLTAAAASSSARIEPATSTTADAAASSRAVASSSELAVKPVLPPGVPEYFLPSSNKGPTYQPKVIGAGSIRFTDTKAKLDVLIDKVFTVELSEGAISLNWSDAKEQKFSVETLETVPADGAKYMALPAVASKPPQYKIWSKDFAGWLATHQKFYLLKSPSTGEYSLPNESDKQFRIRLNESATRARDQAVAQLRSKYTPKVNSLQAKVLQAEQKVQREQEEAKERQMEAAISIGATVLGAFARPKSIGRGASSAAKEAARAVQHQQEIARSEQTLASLRQQFQQLQDDFAKEVAAVKAKYEPTTEVFETISIAPKKTNINVRLLALIWQPI
jgi:hypothetical protein